MQYTPKAFFRLVPKDLLRRYFAGRSELTDFDWDAAEDGGDVSPLFEAWLKLPGASRSEAEAAFRAVWDLSSTEGALILVEEGRYHDLDLSAEFEAREGFHHRAMWVMLEQPHVFKVATDLNHADRLHRRYWRTRTDLPKKEPDDSDANIVEFGRALSAFYAQEGRGADCEIDCYLRAGRKHYYFAYPSDYARTFTGYENGRHVRKPQLPDFEVVFVYDPVDGILELHAQGGKRVATELQTIFSRVILHEELGPESRVARPFELNGLKDRHFRFRTDPADGITEVRVKALRLAVFGRSDRGRLTFEVDARRGAKAVYDLMDSALNQQRIPLSNVNVTLATIQMVFAQPDNKTKTLTFNVSFPESCNLPRETPEGMKARAYLQRWGIARSSGGLRVPESVRGILRTASDLGAAFSVDEVVRWQPGTFAALRRAKWLQQAEPARTVACDACGHDHVEEILDVVDPPGSDARAFIHCPDNLIVEVPRGRRRQWQIDAASVAQSIGSALGAARAPSDLGSGQAWVVRNVEFSGQRRSVAVVAGDADLRLDDEPADGSGRTVILSMTDRLRLGDRTCGFPISDFVTVRESRLTFDVDALGEAINAWEAQLKDRAGLDPNGRYTHIEIADALGLPREPTRKKLERVREKDFNAFEQILDVGRNEPKYLYVWGRVRDAL